MSNQQTKTDVILIGAGIMSATLGSRPKRIVWAVPFGFVRDLRMLFVRTLLQFLCNFLGLRPKAWVGFLLPSCATT
ncbi:malate:quinone oxidoreductase [Paenibacillus borealis]|uniref:malate:quinone oxidoreductase n=1 Tax=Paenibacillus borealis TaxID=160799 RepID=UPI001431B2BC